MGDKNNSAAGGLNAQEGMKVEILSDGD